MPLAVDLRLETRVLGKVTVIRCEGDILQGEAADTLRKTAKAALASGGVLLNLAGARHMDSMGLGMLVGLHTSARSAGRELKLCSPCRRVSNLFEIAQMRLVFDIYDTEEDALSSFSS